MLSFKSIKYGKRPITIYVSNDEYSKYSLSSTSNKVYHETQNGTFYVGNYYYKKTINDKIVVLRRSIM